MILALKQLSSKVKNPQKFNPQHNSTMKITPNSTKQTNEKRGKKFKKLDLGQRKQIKIHDPSTQTTLIKIKNFE